MFHDDVPHVNPIWGSLGSVSAHFFSPAEISVSPSMVAGGQRQGECGASEKARPFHWRSMGTWVNTNF